MKKIFCFNNCSCYNLRKNLSSFDFSFSQVTSVEEREPRGTFLSLCLRPRLQKTFPRFPFFYFGNLGKTKIVRGQIFPQSSTTNYRNKILLFVILTNFQPTESPEAVLGTTFRLGVHLPRAFSKLLLA